MGKKAATKEPDPTPAAAPEPEGPNNTARYKFSDSKDVYEIDPFDLTGEEQVMVEELFDQPWNILLAEGWLTQSRKASIFFAYLARRRKEPAFSYDDALKFDPKYVRREEGEAARPTEDSSTAGSPS